MPRLFSTWNSSKNAWDYYQAQGELRSGVFAEDAPHRLAHQLGLSPNEAARLLPSSSRYVGSGLQAQGMVARKEMGLVDLGPVVRYAVIGGVAYALWKMVR